MATQEVILGIWMFHHHWNHQVLISVQLPLTVHPEATLFLCVISRSDQTFSMAQKHVVFRFDSIARDECLDALSCRTGDTKLAPDAFGWFLGVQTESHVEG